MPLTTQQQKLLKIAQFADSDGLSALRDLISLEEGLQEARDDFKRHIQAIDEILKQLDQKKLDTSEFHDFGEKMKSALGAIKLIPGPRGEKGDVGPKPIAGVDYVIPRDGRDGRDGKTPIKGVDYTDGQNGKDGNEVTPEQVRDKLESLQDDQRLSISAIHELEEILDELRKRPVGRGGGGFSKIAMDSHIIDDETPSGIINGSNTAFILAGDPNPLSSLKVYRNGMRQKVGVGEDYTISGRTITFTIAPVSGEIILCDYRN